ncbi:MAG: beta-galactosidase [Propionibacteriaceae bacterium]|jgi:beta-galactosidase|nr:beta-galactosidase [Propionibacteriaceae bacterium]
MESVWRRPAWAQGDVLAYGGDYCPEQWPEAVWAEDFRLMEEAGVNLVTVGVFAWARLQPAPGRWDFGWLDRVLDGLAEHRIAVCLATATASPPPWLTAAHPEIQLVRADGVRLSHGSRQGWCPSSAAYKDAALELAEQVAGRYAGHPALALWHISNELGCHNPVCYCDESAARFRVWLEDRYETVENLNLAWGTDFWSQRLSAWEEVLPPRTTSYFGNPAHLNDYVRFSSDELRGQLQAEAALLRQLAPDVPVTTNFMLPGRWRSLDYGAWAADVDVVANDHYTLSDDPRPHVAVALAADASRGVGGGRPWLLMEHAASAVSWQKANRAKTPGEMRRNSLAHIAHGAEGALFFQWRAAVAGAERYHSAMLPHAGADSDQFRAVAALGADLAKLAPIAGSTVAAPIGLVVDRDSWAASLRPTLPSAFLDYGAALREWYEALWDAHLTCDVIPSTADFNSYKVLVTPHWQLLDAAEAQRLRDFVEQGGHLVATYFTGVADRCDQVVTGGYPGALRDLLGVRVEEFRPLLEGQEVKLSDGTAGRLWTEPVKLAGATAAAFYVSGPSAGFPAVTRAERGAGVAWYVSTQLNPAGLGEFADRVADEAAVPRIDAPADVEITVRRGAEALYTFVINHSAEAVALKFDGVDLLTGDTGPVMAVPAGDVRVVEQALR